MGIYKTFIAWCFFKKMLFFEKTKENFVHNFKIPKITLFYF